MQTRLLSCLAGGVLGLAVASFVNESLGLSQALAYVVCASVGMAGGCGLSVFLDVFSTPADDDAEA